MSGLSDQRVRRLIGQAAGAINSKEFMVWICHYLCRTKLLVLLYGSDTETLSCALVFRLDAGLWGTIDRTTFPTNGYTVRPAHDLLPVKSGTIWAPGSLPLGRFCLRVVTPGGGGL